MKVFETEVFRVHVYENGFVELQIKHNAMFDAKDIIESKNFIISELRDKKAFILLELEGEAFTSKEARELAASSEHSQHHGAIAINSDKLAYKLLGTLYIKINKPKAPSRFFTKREEAVKWLSDQINK